MATKKPLSSAAPEDELLAYVETAMRGIALTIDGFTKQHLKPGLPASQLAHIFVALRRASDAMIAVNTAGDGADKSLLGGIIKNIKSERVPQAFEAEKITTFTTSTGFRVTISTVYRASIIAAKKLEAYEWLNDNGLGDLIVPTVNASTLSATGKTMLEEGKELPEELFHAFFAPQASITKTNK